MQTIVRRPQGSNLLSYRAFMFIQVCFWLYAIGWFILLTWIYYVWDTPLYYKLGASIFLALLTPDAHSLFQSYHQYRDEWQRGEARKIGREQ